MPLKNFWGPYSKWGWKLLITGEGCNKLKRSLSSFSSMTKSITPQLRKHRHSSYPQKAIGKLNVSHQNAAFASCSHQICSPHTELPPETAQKKENHHGQYRRRYLKGAKASYTSYRQSQIEFGGKPTPKPNQKPPSVYPSNSKPQILLHRPFQWANWGEGWSDPSSWATLLICKSLPSAQFFVLS